MRPRIAVSLLLLLIVTVIAAACSSADSAPDRTAPAPGALVGVEVEVHESPG